MSTLLETAQSEFSESLKGKIPSVLLESLSRRVTVLCVASAYGLHALIRDEEGRKLAPLKDIELLKTKAVSQITLPGGIAAWIISLFHIHGHIDKQAPQPFPSIELDYSQALHFDDPLGEDKNLLLAAQRYITTGLLATQGDSKPVFGFADSIFCTKFDQVKGEWRGFSYVKPYHKKPTFVIPALLAGLSGQYATRSIEVYYTTKEDELSIV